MNACGLVWITLARNGPVLTLTNLGFVWAAPGRFRGLLPLLTGDNRSVVKHGSGTRSWLASVRPSADCLGELGLSGCPPLAPRADRRALGWGQVCGKAASACGVLWVSPLEWPSRGRIRPTSANRRWARIEEPWGIAGAGIGPLVAPVCRVRAAVRPPDGRNSTRWWVAWASAKVRSGCRTSVGAGGGAGRGPDSSAGNRISAVRARRWVRAAGTAGRRSGCPSRSLRRNGQDCGPWRGRGDRVQPLGDGRDRRGRRTGLVAVRAAAGIVAVRAAHWARRSAGGGRDGCVASCALGSLGCGRRPGWLRRELRTGLVMGRELRTRAQREVRSVDPGSNTRHELRTGACRVASCGLGLAALRAAERACCGAGLLRSELRGWTGLKLKLALSGSWGSAREGSDGAAGSVRRGRRADRRRSHFGRGGWRGRAFRRSRHRG